MIESGIDVDELHGVVKPLVSVIVPARNEEVCIEAALLSLARQDYDNFEIILVDDGCEDLTIPIALSLGIPELRVIEGPQAGLARALAVGVEAARGEFIVRQDADDISYPTRLRKQVDFLLQNPDFVMVGTQAEMHDSVGSYMGVVKHPGRDSAIRLKLTLESAFVHPSVALRKSAVISVGGYQSPSSSPFPEDFDLWSRLLTQGRMGNLDDVLCGIGVRDTGITRSSARVIGEHAAVIAARNMRALSNSRLTVLEISKLLRNYYVRDRRITLREAWNIYSLLFRARAKSGLIRGRGGYNAIYFIKPLVWLVRNPKSR